MIDACPRCGYSLVGLPDQHSCPECGLDYEKDATVFREPRMLWKIMAILHGALALFGVGLVVLRPGGNSNLWMPLVYGVIGLVWLWHTRKPKRIILVSPNTIRIVDRYKPVEVYHMHDVGRISWRFVNGDVDIERHDGSELRTIPKRFLGSDVRMIKMVKLVKRYVSERGSERNAGSG